MKPITYSKRWKQFLFNQSFLQSFSFKFQEQNIWNNFIDYKGISQKTYIGKEKKPLMYGQPHKGKYKS